MRFKLIQSQKTVIVQSKKTSKLCFPQDGTGAATGCTDALYHVHRFPTNRIRIWSHSKTETTSQRLHAQRNSGDLIQLLYEPLTSSPQMNLITDSYYIIVESTTQPSELSEVLSHGPRSLCTWADLITWRSIEAGLSSSSIDRWGRPCSSLQSKDIGVFIYLTTKNQSWKMIRSVRDERNWAHSTNYSLQPRTNRNLSLFAALCHTPKWTSPTCCGSIRLIQSLQMDQSQSCPLNLAGDFSED